jgi:hypothetical protein
LISHLRATLDSRGQACFQVLPQFLAETRISAALIGMLHAIPTTPLYERLKKAGRLSDDDASNRYGTNVIPLGISPEELRAGFIKVMQECYRADAYFQRLDGQFIEGNFKFTLHQLPYWRTHRLAWAKRCFLNYVRFVFVCARLLRFVADVALRTR